LPRRLSDDAGARMVQFVNNDYREHPTPTGHLVDGRLVPVPASVEANTTVWLALPAEAGEAQVWEGLAALIGTDTGRVELRAIPLFAYDVNYGDELTVIASQEGPLVATGISNDAGNYTFRVWLEDGSIDVYREVVAQFGEMGCLVEGYSDKLIGFSCDTEAARDVAAALTAHEREGRLIYETGRQRTS
jgi:Domain of unknown function (DUF4265)